jgi:hypothetical protein
MPAGACPRIARTGSPQRTEATDTAQEAVVVGVERPVVVAAV